jgi:hypothetical protein
MRLILMFPLVLAACPDDGATVTTTETTTGSTGGSTTDVGTDSTTGGTDATPTTTTDGDTTTPTDSGPMTDPDPTTGTPVVDTDTSTTEPGATVGETDTSTGGVGECEPGVNEACYSGPKQTLGVGECVGGERTCADDEAWGPCVGEVVPADESCNGGGDEDCDGIDPCGGYAWSRVFGAGGDESGRKVAFDGAGNLVLVARGNSVLDFGGGGLVSAGGYDLFVARFAPDGGHLWSKRFGDAAPQFDEYFALAVDDAGGIAIAGDFAGVLDFGGGPLTANGPNSGFIVRLTADGEHVWSQALDGRRPGPCASVDPTRARSTSAAVR